MTENIEKSVQNILNGGISGDEAKILSRIINSSEKLDSLSSEIKNQLFKIYKESISSILNSTEINKQNTYIIQTFALLFMKKSVKEIGGIDGIYGKKTKALFEEIKKNGVDSYFNNPNGLISQDNTSTRESIAQQEILENQGEKIRKKNKIETEIGEKIVDYDLGEFVNLYELGTKRIVETTNGVLVFQNGSRICEYDEKPVAINYSDDTQNINIVLKDKIVGININNRRYIDFMEIDISDKTYSSLDRKNLDCIVGYNTDMTILNFKNGKSVKLDEDGDICFETGMITQNQKIRLAKLGITDIDRFHSSELIENILNSREHPESLGNKPNFVIFGAKGDKNNAFNWNNREELVEKGYNVLYFESENDEGFKRNLNELERIKKKGINIESVELGGHGRKDGIALGDTNMINISIIDTRGMIIDMPMGDKDKKISIDSSDTYLNTYSHLFIGTNVVLKSCSTGRGGENETNNMVNFLSRSLFRFSKSISGPETPTNGLLEFDGRDFAGIEFSSGTRVYTTEGINYGNA